MDKPGPNRLRSLAALFNLPQVARLFASLLGDPRVSLWHKVAAGAGFVYVFSPLDVIPEFTGIGVLDDIIVSLLIMQTLIDLTPRHIIEGHCRVMHIDPEKLDVDIPKVTGEAIELLLAWWSGIAAARAAHQAQLAAEAQKSAPAAAANGQAAEPVAAAAQAEARPVQPSVETPTPEVKPELPPSAKRYSAYREEQD